MEGFAAKGNASLPSSSFTPSYPFYFPSFLPSTIRSAKVTAWLPTNTTSYYSYYSYSYSSYY